MIEETHKKKATIGSSACRFLLFIKTPQPGGDVPTFPPLSPSCGGNKRHFRGDEFL